MRSPHAHWYHAAGFALSRKQSLCFGLAAFEMAHTQNAMAESTTEMSQRWIDIPTCGAQRPTCKERINAAPCAAKQLGFNSAAVLYRYRTAALERRLQPLPPVLPPALVTLRLGVDSATAPTPATGVAVNSNEAAPVPLGFSRTPPNWPCRAEDRAC